MDIVECGEEPVDVAFVLGETTTRNAESTKQALEFVNGLTSSLNIAEDKVQVALVPKECKNPGFHFNKFSDNDGVAGYLEGYKVLGYTQYSEDIYFLIVKKYL